MAGGTFESDTDGTFHCDIPGTFQSVVDGTFDSATAGTFQSDMGGTFGPLLSDRTQLLKEYLYGYCFFKFLLCVDFICLIYILHRDCREMLTPF